MADVLSTAALAAATALAVWLATRALLPVLVRRAILDQPNARSSHEVPTPRGGGIAVIAVTIPALAVAAWLRGEIPPWPLLAAAGALAALSWLDDLRSLSAGVRLSGQAVAVTLGLFTLGAPVFQGLLPPWLDALAAGVLWLWFVNLFNFMDGIDGIAAAVSAALGIGVALVAAFPLVADGLAIHGAVLAAAALGFLPWNWQRARIFLGDVGSVPLGLLLGWLLLSLAAAGAWKAALILPLYYLADATITLLRRAARGERVWRAHREHFYQRAVQRGLSHAGTVRAMTVGNLVLMGLAAGAEAGLGLAAIPLAMAAVGVLLWRLSATKPA
jgi:UDP-N-acetylmuramyl pentapeptide phosphotransferase/UDP-N-acetylglucosamine-1-phosphate transferase